MMADEAREMRCYDATGCTNSALICFLSEPTLVQGEQPISASSAFSIHVALVEDKSCVKEINGFRTQETLGLKGFTEAKASSKATRNTQLSEPMSGVTCDALKNGTVTIMVSCSRASFHHVLAMRIVTLNSFLFVPVLVARRFTKRHRNGKHRYFVHFLPRLMSDEVESVKFPCFALLFSSQDQKMTKSLMYYSGTEATCSVAVAAWKKGYEQFSAIPPAYTTSEAVYKKGDATNFVSLISEGESTTATCYSVEGCDQRAIVCELSPAVFTKDKAPISESTWKKVTQTMSQGNSAPVSFSTGLLSTALIVAVAFAFNS
ncbi:hypothetical protein ETH_00022280 [Eimeria tenella]|uniref:SAG family member n=1 Tax=Eimeria tenella TaxID=5802 RepID=U6KUM7_EIMTE|nr:hypothetical protein ETH_00022280 [Eimeria tenella]CDJ41852.1 hypothetical protein ETH_00022280 [Eimeria tenella]|eukprot:XP_013232602.1 hypothetical protein ETH_00022280 [Eimeria tenella]